MSKDLQESQKNKSRWLTIGQAAHYLNISKDTLRRWEKKGKIKAVRSPTNRRYYTKEQLDLSMSTKNVSKNKQELLPHSSPKNIIPGIISFLIAVILGLLCILFLIG